MGVAVGGAVRDKESEEGGREVVIGQTKRRLDMFSAHVTVHPYLNSLVYNLSQGSPFFLGRLKCRSAS